MTHDTAKKALALAVLALLTGPTVFPVEKAGPSLPKDGRATLDKECPGWRFAALAAEFRGLLGPGDSPEWIQGDYDGDGKPDYAAQIICPASPSPAQKTVALLRRAGGFERHTLESFGVGDYTFLHPIRKGEELYDFEQDRTMPSPRDAIMIVYEEKASVTHLFEKGAFHRMITAD